MRRLALCLPVLAWAAGFGLFLWRVPAPPADPELRTDGIVVLTGPENARLGRGLDLFAGGSAPALLISGVTADMTPARVLRWAHRAGLELPPGLTLGARARDTLGNAAETAEWVCANHIRSLRVVTADYHMARSLWLLRQAMPTMAFVADPLPDGRPLPQALARRLVDYDKGLVQHAMRWFGLLRVAPPPCGVA